MTEPVNAASIALFHNDEILLIRRAFAPSQGMWTLPGGRLETGETHEQAIRREIEEELALTIGAVVPVMEQQIGTFRLTIFAGRFPDDATPIPNDEIAGWQWHVLGADLPLPHTPGLAIVLAKARAAIDAMR